MTEFSNLGYRLGRLVDKTLFAAWDQYVSQG